MPPAIPQYESQNESSDDADVIPGRGANPITKKAGLLMDDALDQDDQDEEEDDNDDDEGDEYAVEKIISHDFDDGGIVTYKVKWQDYDDEKDQTWEPEENLRGSEALAKYHKQIGGKPVYKPATPAAKGRGRGKRKSQPAADTPELQSSAKTKRQKTNGSTIKSQPELPVGSWEDDIEEIIQVTLDNVEDGSKKFTDMLCTAKWNDGRTMLHTVVTIRQKCPQKLLDYLIDKIQFTAGAKAETAPSEQDL